MYAPSSSSLMTSDRRVTILCRCAFLQVHALEDSVLSELLLDMLSQKYQTEQQELEEKIGRLKGEIEAVKQTEVDARKWIGLLRQYGSIEALDAELLNNLIEKITIHEAVKGEGGTRDQNVDIYYRFIGKIE